MKRPRFGLRTLIFLMLAFGILGGFLLPGAVSAFQAWLQPPPGTSVEYSTNSRFTNNGTWEWNKDKSSE